MLAKHRFIAVGAIVKIYYFKQKMSKNKDNNIFTS